MFSRFVQGASDVASDAFTGVENTIRNIPSKIAPARQELLKRSAQSLPQQAQGYVDDVKKSWDRDVTQPYKQMKEDWNKPYDESKGWLKRPARFSHTAIQAAGIIPGMGQALIASGPGRTIEALTGVDREAAGLAGTMLLAPELGKGVRRVAGKTMEPVIKAGQKRYAPETISENARHTGSLYRMAQGNARGDAAAEQFQLEKHQRVVGNATPREQETLAKYVDTRTSGGIKLHPKLQPAADAMRNVYTRYRSRIENVLGEDGPKFIRDYYSRMWANSPEEVAKAMEGHSSVGGGKQGSGRSLRKRTLPTYQDGIERGLVPKFRNPIDATNAYTDNMASYLATHDTLNGMKKTSLAKWTRPGQNIPPGTVRLEGIGTTMKAMVSPKGGLLGERFLVADENVARVYNRTVGKGMEDGAFPGLYKGARALSNAAAQVKLGLSTFHATVMGEEALVSTFAKGLNRTLKGDVTGGLKDMAKSPAAIFNTARKGGKLMRAGLDPENADFHLKGMDPGLVQSYRDAGGRFTMDRFYGTQSASGGFYRSLRNGTFARDMGDSLRKLGHEPIKGTLELTGKIMDTVSAPIFKELVPRLKMGAWASNMEQWLDENPEASAVERQRYAESAVTNMDNRFGEVIIDNNFWPKVEFQIAQLLLLSPSWNFGTVREIGGGVAELPASVRSAIKGEGVSAKTAYVAALVGTYMIQNGIATRLHTGEMPDGEKNIFNNRR